MAAAAPPETALPAAAGPEYEEVDEDDNDEEQCRICRLPAEAGRPLRRPCGCRGSIRFVHDHCQLRWLAARHKNECEVCKHAISTCPLYAADAPTILPLSELMVSLPNKLAGLLLPLFFAAYVAGNSGRHFVTLWTWRIAFARTSAQVLDLFCLRLDPSSVLASLALWVVFVHWVAPSAVAPFARWVTHLETRHQGLQLFALFSIKASLTAVIVDMALACIFGFLPFSLGRIILWCSSYIVNVNEVESYTSTSYTLRIRYGFIFNLGVCLAVQHAFHHYSRSIDL